MDSNVTRSRQSCDRKLDKSAHNGAKSLGKYSGKKCVKSVWDVAKIIPELEE